MAVFKDEVSIYVQAGRGGDGCVSFRREKYVPKGGPDGGDGGRGGAIILVPSRHVASLTDFHSKQRFIAENGRPGEGAKRTGRDGRDLEIRCPLGTIVRDGERGHLLRDLESEEPFLVARGGRGGRGNVHFATATNRTPRQAEPGEPGEGRWLALELKLLADVGLIGLPNAGKSTLLSRLSRARPRIAPYPFTTLTPHLGILEIDYRVVVIADIPGLIEGAHRGEGLGDRFLRHVERTCLLLHLIDGTRPDGDLAMAYAAIRNELRLYDPKLEEKPEIVAITKMDAVTDREAVREKARSLGAQVHYVSAVTGEGLKGLIGVLAEKLSSEGAEHPPPLRRSPARGRRRR
ncbi:MAG: GTPase ObgE [Planctomycetota bacterium]